MDHTWNFIFLWNHANLAPPFFFPFNNPLNISKSCFSGQNFTTQNKNHWPKPFFRLIFWKMIFLIYPNWFSYLRANIYIYIYISIHKSHPRTAGYKVPLFRVFWVWSPNMPQRRVESVFLTMVRMWWLLLKYRFEPTPIDEWIIICVLEKFVCIFVTQFLVL